MRVTDPVLEACRNRVAALLTLGDGWHDGSGKAPTQVSAGAALTLLGHFPATASGCSIFPTEAGGLLLEFVRAGWDISIEICPDGLAALSCVELSGPGEIDSPMLDPSGVAFARFLDAAIHGQPPVPGIA